MSSSRLSCSRRFDLCLGFFLAAAGAVGALRHDTPPGLHAVVYGDLPSAEQDDRAQFPRLRRADSQAPTLTRSWSQPVRGVDRKLIRPSHDRHRRPLRASGIRTSQADGASPLLDHSRFDEMFVVALRRVHNDFLEMPGLQLTPDQGARLWSFDLELCRAVLDALAATRFLTRSRGSVSRAPHECARSRRARRPRTLSTAMRVRDGDRPRPVPRDHAGAHDPPAQWPVSVPRAHARRARVPLGVAATDGYAELMPLAISVIVCAHNEARWLGACLHSVLAQTRPPDEVLVVNNASTDATRASRGAHPRCARRGRAAQGPRDRPRDRPPPCVRRRAGVPRCRLPRAAALARTRRAALRSSTPIWWRCPDRIASTTGTAVGRALIRAYDFTVAPATQLLVKHVLGIGADLLRRQLRGPPAGARADRRVRHHDRVPRRGHQSRAAAAARRRGRAVPRLLALHVGAALPRDGHAAPSFGSTCGTSGPSCCTTGRRTPPPRREADARLRTVPALRLPRPHAVERRRARRARGVDLYGQTRQVRRDRDHRSHPDEEGPAGAASGAWPRSAARASRSSRRSSSTRTSTTSRTRRSGRWARLRHAGHPGRRDHAEPARTARRTRTSSRSTSSSTSAPTRPADEILREIRRQDALSIACHPHHRTTRRIEISTCYLWDNRKTLAPLVDVWEAANRDDLFSVTSLKHYPYVANSDFHKPQPPVLVEDAAQVGQERAGDQGGPSPERGRGADALSQRRLVPVSVAATASVRGRRHRAHVAFPPPRLSPRDCPWH